MTKGVLLRSGASHESVAQLYEINGYWINQKMTPQGQKVILRRNFCDTAPPQGPARAFGHPVSPCCGAALSGFERGFERQQKSPLLCTEGVIWSGKRDSNPRLPAWEASILPLNYSRTEKKNMWSGRRDLNPRLQPWQGCTLPLSYSRSTKRDTTLPPPFCQQKTFIFSIFFLKK